MSESGGSDSAHFWGWCGLKCDHFYQVELSWAGSWESQPAELRALGKYHARRVLERQLARAFEEMDGFIDELEAEWEAHQAVRATMTTEELAADDARLKAEETAASEEFHHTIFQDLERWENEVEARRKSLRRR